MSIRSFSLPLDFLDSCRANTLLAELDDEEDLPEPDDDDDENEDDNQEDQEYEEVLVRKSIWAYFKGLGFFPLMIQR